VEIHLLEKSFRKLLREIRQKSIIVSSFNDRAMIQQKQTEVKEKIRESAGHDQELVEIRFHIPRDLHTKLMMHKHILTGQLIREVKFPEACIDVMSKGTEHIKVC
jgi:hypothetical protein